MSGEATNERSYIRSLHMINTCSTHGNTIRQSGNPEMARIIIIRHFIIIIVYENKRLSVMICNHYSFINNYLL